MTTENIIPQPADLATLLAAMLGDGREVRFVKDPNGSGDYFADIDTVDANGKPVIHTGIADTALGALEAAAEGMARYAPAERRS